MHKTTQNNYDESKIEPNLGIGPFYVGMHESELFTYLPWNNHKRKVGNLYTTMCGNITLWVNRDSKVIEQVGVSGGFKGKLFGAIAIGTTIEEAENLVGSFLVDDDYQLIINGLPGISFHTNPVVNDFAPKPESNWVIDGIYVYKSSNA